jgi:hypothetical protein
MTNTTTPWIQGLEVLRINFRDGLVVNFDESNELVVFVSLVMTLPPVRNHPVELVTVNPLRVREQERALFDMAGAICSRAFWDEDGDLHLEFSTGHQIDVRHSQTATAWELHGRYHGYVACLPHGQVREVRHDLPVDEN